MYAHVRMPAPRMKMMLYAHATHRPDRNGHDASIIDVQVVVTQEALEGQSIGLGVHLFGKIGDQNLVVRITRIEGDVARSRIPTCQLRLFHGTLHLRVCPDPGQVAHENGVGLLENMPLIEEIEASRVRRVLVVAIFFQHHGSIGLLRWYSVIVDELRSPGRVPAGQLLQCTTCRHSPSRICVNSSKIQTR